MGAWWKRAQAGSKDEGGEDEQHGDAADVVDPFADVQAADGSDGDDEDDEADDGERGGLVFRQPGGARADEVGELGGDGVEDGGDDGDAVDPEVPGGEEAGEVAEGAAGPDVEAAFEGHLRG